jgi:hypothetical protein
MKEIFYQKREIRRVNTEHEHVNKLIPTVEEGLGKEINRAVGYLVTYCIRENKTQYNNMRIKVQYGTQS